jgi:hypothetical protein
MSRITLGAVHGVLMHCPAHTWFVIFYFNEEDCVGEYMQAELHTTIDTTPVLRLVHINLVHVSRQVPLSVVHLDFPQLGHATTTTPHSTIVKLSQLPHILPIIFVYNKFRSLQQSLVFSDVATQQVMVPLPRNLLTRFISCATVTKTRVNCFEKL